MKIGAIVLAAGLGTRMNSDLVKVLHPLCGKPLLFYVLDLLLAAKVEKSAIVVSHQKQKIMEAVKGCYGAHHPFIFVDQKTPRGTGHAVMKGLGAFKNFKEPIFILSGDVPLLTLKTVRLFYNHHQKEKAQLTVGSAILDKSVPYGRVIRDDSGNLVEVVETIDATPQQRKIEEMNIGLYCAEPEILAREIKKIKPDNKKQEYYLTDIIKWVSQKRVFCVKNSDEILGVNNRFDLYQKEAYVRKAMNKQWMLNGVTLKDPSTTYIDAEVILAKDVVLYPQVHLEGKTLIGQGTVVGVGAIIRNSQIGPHVRVEAYTLIEDSRVDEGAVVGPFARLRPKTHIKKQGKVGSFVELKKTTLGEKSKVNHLSYLGDAEIGKEVNVGCGVITCNYDGGLRFQGKAITTIGDQSFIGSDVQLVAPVHFQRGAYVASGTTVTRDVPADSLVIARVKQTTKKGYMKRLWAKAGKKKR